MLACVLLVAAASDLSGLQDALKAVAQDATKCDVRFTFGASGQLAQQIQNGAPFDLFLSASPDFVKPLRAFAVKPYARGRLALWSKHGFQDPLDPKVQRISIANPR